MKRGKRTRIRELQDTMQEETRHKSCRKLTTFHAEKAGFAGENEWESGKRKRIEKKKKKKKRALGGEKWNTAGEANTHSPLTPFPILY